MHPRVSRSRRGCFLAVDHVRHILRLACYRPVDNGDSHCPGMMPGDPTVLRSVFPLPPNGLEKDHTLPSHLAKFATPCLSPASAPLPKISCCHGSCLSSWSPSSLTPSVTISVPEFNETRLTVRSRVSSPMPPTDTSPQLPLEGHFRHFPTVAAAPPSVCAVWAVPLRECPGALAEPAPTTTARVAATRARVQRPGGPA
jgi:hypothetical protein